MARNEKEKRDDEPRTGRRILGVAAVGAVAIAAGAFLLLSKIGESKDGGQDTAADDDPPARPRRTMKAPDAGGEVISRDKFEAAPSHYFRTNRQEGRKAAVDAFKERTTTYG